MKEYAHSISLFNLPTRTSPQWIKVIRGMINGLRFLHIHKIGHGKLKLHNVFIKDNYVAQLAGLANTDWSDEEKVSMDDFLRLDIYNWGKILLNIMTHGHHGGDYTWDLDSVPQILEELREGDEEVRDLLNGEISNVQSLLEELPGQFFTYMRSGDPSQQYHGCGYFKWKDEITIRNASSFARPSTPLISSSCANSSSGPSGGALSPGNAECLNCKLLTMNIKILEARLAIDRQPDDHACSQLQYFMSF
nr:hypothetical protein [Tanacetum cinerariifolium]